VLTLTVGTEENTGMKMLSSLEPHVDHSTFPLSGSVFFSVSKSVSAL
jgi:hypothetical protein